MNGLARTRSNRSSPGSTSSPQSFKPVHSTVAVSPSSVSWVCHLAFTMNTGAMRDLAALPKAHLHVHLESTIRWSTLREIGDANRVPVPDHLAAGAVFDGFRSFGDAN